MASIYNYASTLPNFSFATASSLSSHPLIHSSSPSMDAFPYIFDFSAATSDEDVELPTNEDTGAGAAGYCVIAWDAHSSLHIWRLLRLFYHPRTSFMLESKCLANFSKTFPVTPALLLIIINVITTHTWHPWHCIFVQLALLSTPIHHILVIHQLTFDPQLPPIICFSHHPISFE